MIKAFIEVEAGSREKRVYNEKTLEYIKSSTVLTPYPYPYGFIVDTAAEDGDGVDCYIITPDKLKPRTVIDCEPIGLLEMIEDGEVDHKVLLKIPGQKVKTDISLRDELRDFIYHIFEKYAESRVKINQILSKEAALAHIQLSQKKLS